MKTFEEYWDDQGLGEPNEQSMWLNWDVGLECRRAWQACDAEYQPIIEAAKCLANEVAACTGMDEAEMRHLLGNTNFNCLIRRMNEVRELLNRKKS